MNTKAVVEKEVPGYPGWIKLQKGGSRRYISPGGAEISATAFMKLQGQFGFGNDIPESAVAATFQKREPRSFLQPLPSKPNLGNQNQSPPDSVSEIIPDMPDAKVRPGKSSGSKASPAELSNGIYITLSIVTAIVALLTQAPELSMTEQEAKNISIPAANLMAQSKLNEKFGRLIADSGDWQLLGYSLFLYGSRVMETMKLRGALNFGKRTTTGGNATQTGGGVQPGNPSEPAPVSTNGYNGAAMPISTTGLGRIATPPGVRF